MIKIVAIVVGAISVLTGLCALSTVVLSSIISQEEEHAKRRDG